MTLFDVEELTSYWAQHPPVHLLVAACLGFGNGKRQSISRQPIRPVKPSDANVGAMLAQLGPGFAAQDVHAGLSPVILDFAELRRAAEAGD